MTDYQKKSKEELAQELHELQVAFNSLKTSYDKNITHTAKLSDKVTELSWMIEHAGDSAIYRGNYQTMQYEYWSPNVEQVLGFTIEEMFAMGQSGVIKFMDSNDLAKLNILIGNLMAKGGGSYSIEYRFTAKDGSIRNISESGHAFVDEKNVPLYAIGSIRDITDRKKVEKALKESEDLFSLFLQFSPIYVYIKEVSSTVSRVITSSHNYIDMIGISSSEMKGKTMEELFPTEFASKITHDDWEVVTKGIVLQIEENFNNHYYTTIKFPIMREGKTLLAGYTIDITERKQSEKMFQDIIDKNPISIQILDMEGYTIQVNTAFKNIFGVTPPTNYSIFKDPQLIEQGFNDAFEKMKKGEVVNFPNSYYNASVVDPSFPNNPLWLKGVGFTLNLNSDSPGKIVLMHENITHQILAEEARIESEDKFKTIFENSIVGISVTYLNGSLKTNRAFCEIVGYSEKELSDLKWQNITHPDDILRDENILKSILSGDTSFKRWEKRYIKKNGDIVWVDISTTLQRDKEGKPFYFITSIHDNTERKQAEETLRKSEELYRNLVEKLPDGVYKSTHDGKFVEVNPAMFKMLGYDSKEELMAIDIKTQLYFDLSDRESLVLQQTNAEVGVYPLKKKDGSAIWVEDNGWYNVDGNGNIISHEGIMRDITERKLAEEKLKESEKRYKVLHNASFGGIGIHDKGLILECNQGLSEMTGYSLNELIGMNGLLLIAPESRELVMEKINTDFEKPYEAFGLRKNGEIYPIRLSGKGVPYKGKKVRSVEFRDITEQKQAEIDLLTAKEAADANSANVTAIIEGTVDSIWAFNRNYEIIYINQVFQKEFFQTFGAKLEPGVSLIEALPEPLQPFWKPRYDRVLNNEQFTVEDAIDTGNGMVYIQVSFNPIIKNGNVIGGSCFGSNITHRKLAEIELIKAKEKAEENEKLYHSIHTLFRLMADTMPDMIWAKDLDNKYIFTNKALCEKLLNAADTLEPIGKTDIFFAQRERNAHADNPQWHTFGEICADTDTITINNLREMQFDEYGNVKGKFLFLDVHKAPLYDTLGKLIGVVGSARDITARKQSEEALVESEKKFKTIIETSPDAIAIASIDGIIQFATANALQLWGYETTDDFYGKNVMELIHLSYREKANYFITELVNGNITGVSEYLMLRKDSSNFYVEANADILRDANNNPIGILYVVRDITSRKLSETALIHQYQMQEILMNIASKYINIPLTLVEATIQKSLEEIGRFANVDRVYIFDYDWDTDVCNNTHEWCDEGIEPQINELQHVPLNKITWQVEPHKKGEALYIADVLAMPKDNSFRQILEAQDIKSMMTIPMMKEQVCIGFIGFDSVKNYHNYTEKEKVLFTVFAQMLVNIYNRKILDQDLIEAKNKAEESNRLKSAFLANMSHEIRTPMNGILGFAELLKRPELTGKQQIEYLRIIEKSGVRMLNIINDIIDISKIEAGQMKIDLNDSNINEQIEYIYTFFKPEVETRGMKLSFKNSLQSKEAIIKTDREKVYAILTNLVKNAIKYSEKGSIEFGYDVVDTMHAVDTIHASYLQFYVKDTGIGIPKNRHEAIFERFIQADLIDTMARQGAGLGLSITKAYVEMLGGQIWVESELERGSTFYFTLPYTPKIYENEFNKNEYLPGDLNKQFESKTSKLKILIAEDDETSELLISYMIEKYCKELLKVHTGSEAIEACRSNPDIDLIMMDIQMPEMSGYEATRQIRKFNKNVVIIAQTAYGLSGDKEKALEAGCNDYISKPLSNILLNGLILKHFSNQNK